MPPGEHVGDFGTPVHTRSRGVTLANFLRERFGVGRLDDLTLQEASRAIDALKTLDVGQAG